MIQAGPNSQRFRDINRRIIRFSILIIAAGLSFAFLILPIATRPSYYPIKAGDVAPQDIQAPSVISYTSDVRTEELRAEAEQRVTPVYLAADPSIARQQIEKLRSTLNFISTVRADAYANPEQKFRDLSALENVQLTVDDANRILAINDTRWQTIQEESLAVLEEVMRNTIQEGQVKEAQRTVPTLISFILSPEQAQLVASLVTPFVIPNSLYSEEQTAAARAEARNSVMPVTRTFAAGEIIVRRGQIISPSAWEALGKFGLIEQPNNNNELMATSALVAAIAIFIAQYAIRRKLGVFDSLRSLALIAVTFLAFLYFSRLIIPNRTVIPYVFPLQAFGLTVACLFNLELGMVLSLILSILAAYGLPNSLDLTIFYALSSLFGILILGKGTRIGNFFWSGIGVGAVGSAMILAYRLPSALTDLAGIATLTVASFFNGMASASLALILTFLISQVLGLSTALQLLEISRPDHPLQQFILQNAPGSYQHSLQVAIMAEQAAERIGADALLVRVGAIYHDAGKALNPQFFIENQVPGNLNPHDDIKPAESAQTIIHHVTEGVQLGRRHRLPIRIIDFMREHHGTLITRYQYARALEAVNGDVSQVDINLFRYPGPRPQSRETALLMLADGCQARARAEFPENEEQMRALVRKVISYCQSEGQLDDTRLTLRDLNIITESFVRTLQNTYHPRIRYPEIKVIPPVAGLLEEQQRTEEDERPPVTDTPIQ